MIVRQRPKAWELVGIWRLQIVPRIAPQIVFIAAFSAVVAGSTQQHAKMFQSLTVAPFMVLGIALPVFRSFRNAHLRGEGMREEMQRYVPMAETVRGSRGSPAGLLRELAREAGAMLDGGTVGEVLCLRFDERLSAMAAIQVACERTKETRAPFPYTLELHRTAYVFCFPLPVALVGIRGYLTPLCSALGAVAFFGLDELGNELEKPFCGVAECTSAHGDGANGRDQPSGRRLEIRACQNQLCRSHRCRDTWHAGQPREL